MASTAKKTSVRKAPKDSEVLYVTRERLLEISVSNYLPSRRLDDGRLVFRFKKDDMERLKNHYRIRNGELIPYEEQVNAQ